MTELPPQRHWCVEIHHVRNQDRQQRVLEAFRDIARAGVTALGSQCGDQWFVVVETGTVEDRFLARDTISAVDPHATRAYSFKAPSIPGPMPA